MAVEILAGAMIDMKQKKLKSLFTLLPSLLIIASALAVVFKIFVLPPKVEANSLKIIELEKDKNVKDIEIKHILELLTEVRSDVKRLVISRIEDK